ncbi:hypothetical protein GCM10022408_33570 [Hymenobacter fastidiosus]|uniref:DUF4440 domain-containing protein n=1 Tax=Hymenobacter fastidiosus TaxID=486264 RepID=A0ABP7SWC1_9BACT
MKTYKLGFALFLVCLIGCNGKKVNTESEGQKVMQLSRDWSKLAATDSLEKNLSYWADDAVYMFPGQPSLVGKQAIRQMVEKSMNIPGFRVSWEPISVSVSESGDMAYLLEKSQITVNDSLGKPKTEYNKAISIWKKVNGDWKNVVQMWNSNPTDK